MHFSLWPSDRDYMDSKVHSVDCSLTVVYFTLSFWIIVSQALVTLRNKGRTDTDTTTSLWLTLQTVVWAWLQPLCENPGLKSSKSKVNMKPVIRVCNETRSPLLLETGPQRNVCCESDGNRLSLLA